MDSKRHLVSITFRGEGGDLRPLYSSLGDLEKLILLEALSEHRFVRVNAAKALAITARQMYRLCQKHGLGRK